MTAAPVLCFTGARTGLTPAQLAALRVVLAGYAVPGAVLHNGCAEGADEACLELADILDGVLVLWPCNAARRLWAFGFVDGRDYWSIQPTLPPLERNARMVAAASVVVACPDGPERTRSGTWSTVREARRMGREVVVVWPSGEVTRERGRGHGG
jgi:hypothetical protein